MYEASSEDFLHLAGVGDGANSGGGGDKVYVARMQGLPYRATEMEIVSVHKQGLVQDFSFGGRGASLVPRPCNGREGKEGLVFIAPTCTVII